MIVDKTFIFFLLCLQVIEGLREADQSSLLSRNYTTAEFNTVFPFERSYFALDPYNFYLWITDYWTISILASVLYLVVIFGIQRWMRDRKPYDLRYPLFMWNLGLAVFSILGSHRTFAELLFVLREHGFEHSVCVAR